MDMPELKLRKHSFYIFQLNCLCLTSKLPELPAIKFSGVDCNDPRSKLFDVIMPAQSYLANVANSVAVCTTEASLGTFKDLEFRFSSGNVPGDPWSHVDSFGKANLHNTLIAVYLLAFSRLLSVLSTQPQIVSVSGCPAELIPLLERSCFFQKGIEYSFRFDALSLPDMMHERWGSVFGTFSFFSQLKFLVALLDGCSGQPWAALMPEFVKVRVLSVRL